MGLTEDMREITQDRLDREWTESAPAGCVEFFERTIQRGCLVDDLQRYDVETYPVSGFADRTAPVLGHLGVGLSESVWSEYRDGVIAAKAERDAKRSRGESVPVGISGIAGLPAWAVKELWSYIETCGPTVTLAGARHAFIDDLRRRAAALPPLGPKPEGYDEWRDASREAAEDGSDWTEDDDDRLGDLIAGR